MAVPETVSVVIPAMNEAGAIASVVRGLTDAGLPCGVFMAPVLPGQEVTFSWNFRPTGNSRMSWRGAVYCGPGSTHGDVFGGQPDSAVMTLERGLRQHVARAIKCCDQLAELEVVPAMQYAGEPFSAHLMFSTSSSARMPCSGANIAKRKYAALRAPTTSPVGRAGSPTAPSSTWKTTASRFPRRWPRRPWRF